MFKVLLVDHVSILSGKFDVGYGAFFIQPYNFVFSILLCKLSFLNGLKHSIWHEYADDRRIRHFVSSLLGL